MNTFWYLSNYQTIKALKLSLKQISSSQGGFYFKFYYLQSIRIIKFTERGDSVVTHETRIREVSDSNPGADQPDGSFHGFPQSSRQMLGWIFITTNHLTIIHQIHISYN